MGIENLIENVDSQIIQIRTRSLDVSFNELYDMYSDGELVISPDYQRLFRWDEEKQSRFIESLLLEMPVPPIFVIEIKDGVYELIDGLQRISSYLHFRGERLGDTEDDYLILKGCDIVRDLDSITYPSLPKSLQIKIKRSFVRMEVIRKESEPSLKYHMFKRLNTGGELLSAQEIRNCTIRLLNSEALNFIEKCSENEDFKSVIKKINKEDINKKYDQELVLRFFAIKNDIGDYRYPVTEFLTRYLENITNHDLEFNYDREEKLFKKTFSFIAQNLGEDIFSSKTKNGNMKNDFVTYLYDGITIALADLVDEIKEKDYEKVVRQINTIKYSDEIQSYKTGSVNGVTKRIELFKTGVEEVIDN